MKNLHKRVKVVTASKVFCMALLVLSLLVAVYIAFDCDNIMKRSISSYGVRISRSVFYIFGITTTLAIVFNLIYLCHKFGIKHLMLDIGFGLAALLHFISVFTLVKRNGYWEDVVHMWTAVGFLIVCAVCLVAILVYGIRKKRIRILYLYSFLFIIVFCISYILLKNYSYKAVTELFIVVFSEILIFFLNFVLKLPKTEQSLELLD